MAESVRIQVRADGPLVVSGPVELVDSRGERFPLAPGKSVYLCRCGQSAAKPFCDGSHRRVNFRSDPRAQPDQPSQHASDTSVE
ncbi:MAG: CDGSH iron-sulfur domain-containing protein [Thermoguttaceae bacterium]|nr:CDGSH iron-sulfur domain-containing protein [Thermoguttaceae bacterium]MDW8037137.1 CDGSH iron-sulfur domain-containing protein [Thermoguttaceae bacterium]